MKQVRIMELRGTYKGGGGPDKTVLLSAAKHSQKDFFVLVTYLRDPNDHEFQIGAMADFYGVPYYVEVLDRSMMDWICIRELNRLIRIHKLEIIHVHDLKTTLLGVILKILNPKVKIMHTAHGWIIHTNTDKLKLKIQYLLLKCYPLHIAVSKATRDLMLKSGIPGKNITVLYNSIDTSYWKKGRGVPSLRREYNIPDGSLVVGTVGRLSREKDLPTFFQVAKKILEKHPQTVFFIVGDGKADVVDELKELVNAMGLSDSIYFTGHRTDLLDIYTSFDLFLMTSLTEGLPNTVLEAMALEIPVVGTSVGGVPELVVDGDTGFLCSTGDVNELTRNTLRLIEDDRKREQVGRAARSRICNCFDFKRRLTVIEEIYRNLN